MADAKEKKHHHHHDHHHHKDHHQHKEDQHKEEKKTDAEIIEENLNKKEKLTPSEADTLSKDELEKLKQEAAEYKDKYLRLLAEGDNMRKRVLKEKQEMIQYGVQNAITEFLAPIDHFENALKFTQNMSEDVKQWAIGFQMILNQFKDALSNNGVTAFQSVQTAFDPHHHEAVEIVETTEHPEGTVVEESLKGYKMGGRTIRPARVKVAKAPPKEQKNNNNKEEEKI